MGQPSPESDGDEQAAECGDTLEAPRKRRGRPPGSKTRTLPIVTEEPARCPRCESTDRRVVRTTTREFSGQQLPNGQNFDSVTWRHVVCKNCGLLHLQKAFYFGGRKVG